MKIYDAMRAVRMRRYQLIHNLMPERPWVQNNNYKESQYPGWDEMQLLNLQGKLTPPQAAFLADRKPVYELFDLEQDPEELRNLADDPKLAAVKKDLLTRLEIWRKEIHDPGVSKSFREGGKDWQPSREASYWEQKIEQYRKRAKD